MNFRHLALIAGLALSGCTTLDTVHEPIPVSSSDADTLGFSSQVPISSESISISSSASLAHNNQQCTYDWGAEVLLCPEHLYHTVTIGGQVWMAENLDVGSQVTNQEAGQTDDYLLEKYCIGDDPSQCQGGYGGLYQWAQAMDIVSDCNAWSCTGLLDTSNHQGICPMGWHIPTESEWDRLVDTLGGAELAGGIMRSTSSGFVAWDQGNANHGDSSGFAALPAGRASLGSGYGFQGTTAIFWVVEERSANEGLIRYLDISPADVVSGWIDKRYGASLRCVMDP